MSKMDFSPTNKEKRCQWYAGADMTQCPHLRTEWQKDFKIASSVLDVIGNTPMIKLNKIPQSLGIKCDILAKCECYQPAGSVKDRVGIAVLKQAEHDGLINPGETTIIVPTSGNSGIGVALACVVKGYPCIICMSEKFSMEKQYVLEALGAQVVRTPVAASSFAPDGIFGKSYQLCAQIGKAWVADQYSFPANPMVHYDTTAEEILDQCDGELAMYVSSTGTGGTLSGVAQRLKEKCPGCKIIAVDPWGSQMARPKSLNECDVKYYEVEGIGYDFEPLVIHYESIDEWQKVGDQEGHLMARRIIREEGILCACNFKIIEDNILGASSGSAMVVALNAAKNLQAGQKCVVIIPDSIRNYLTKFVDDHWMELKKFQRPINTNHLWWWDKRYTDLGACKPTTATPDMTIHRVFHLMKKAETDVVVIVDDKIGVMGTAEEPALIKKLIKGEIKDSDKISKCMNTLYPKATPDSNLGLISRILEIYYYVVIYQDMGDCIKLNAVVKPLDVLHYSANRGSVCC